MRCSESKDTPKKADSDGNQTNNLQTPVSTKKVSHNEQKKERSPISLLHSSPRVRTPRSTGLSLSNLPTAQSSSRSQLFLSEINSSIMQALNASLAFLRHEISYSVLNSPVYQLNITSNTGGYNAFHGNSISMLPVGSRIYYQSNISDETYTVGIVQIADPVTLCYSIRLPDGTCENNVPFTSRVFSSPPLFPLLNKADLRRTYLDHQRNGMDKNVAEFDVGKEHLTAFPTTAHLLSLLQFCLSWNEGDIPGEFSRREGFENYDSHGLSNRQDSWSEDADMICGQIVWLLGVTLAHHSSTAVNIEVYCTHTYIYYDSILKYILLLFYV